MPGSRTGSPPQGARSESVASTTTSAKGTPGRCARDEGAAAALAAVHHLTRDAARRSIERWAATGVVFGADEVRADVEEEVGDLPVSGSPAYMGGLFLAAKSAGLIISAGVRRSGRPSRHHGLQLTWVGAEVQR